MRRREFITFLSAATAAWPLPLSAQQPGMPVIGFLNSVPFAARRDQVAAFHRGLGESGYAEGRNVEIEYRSAENDLDRLPALASELVNRGVSVIVTIGGDLTALTAKAATDTVPIVFVVGGDPVQVGLIASLNRPGGNLTGISFLNVLTVAKRLELLSQLASAAATLGVMVNPNNLHSDTNIKDAERAARTLGKNLIVAAASTDREVDVAFAKLVEAKATAILVEIDPFFLARRDQIVALAARHKLPALYAFREFATAGGLMSYGTSLADAYRHAGAYAGRILKGEKPGELPVVQPTRFEYVINLKTAKALGLEIPDKVLALADEVIE